MVAAVLSRVVILLCGILYPAYSSFKAVRSKNPRSYTKWMMYWIVFALFQAVETVTDIFLSWVPLYFELKIVFVLWLVLPITQGSKQLYRIIIHPFLLKHEIQIDEYLSQAKTQGFAAVRRISQQGINKAATTVVTSAMRGQAVIAETLLRAQDQPDGDGRGEVESEAVPTAAGLEGRGREGNIEGGGSERENRRSVIFEEFEVIHEHPEELALNDDSSPFSPEDGTVQESYHSSYAGQGVYRRPT